MVSLIFSHIFLANELAFVNKQQLQLLKRVLYVLRKKFVLLSFCLVWCFPHLFNRLLINFGSTNSLGYFETAILNQIDKISRVILVVQVLVDLPRLLDKLRF